MERNLYAPPAAPVADPLESLGDRPAQVAWAMWLLWMALGIGLVAPILQSMILFTFGGVLMQLIFNAIRSLVTAWINIKIGQGRNWARMVMLLWTLAVLSLMAYEWRAFQRLLSGDALYWLPPATKLLLDCTALALLFTPAANRWFKQ
jgi:hypothetical protein